MLKLKLETLTPIWTGDIHGDGGRDVFATSLLGSMRWWLEALMRGVGADVPDPTASQPVFNPDHAEALDPASRMFGATGLRRRFRLDVEHACKGLPRPAPIHGGHGRSWHFSSGGMKGPLTLTVVPLAPGLDTQILHDLIAFQTKWAGLGARTQMGFGVCSLGTPSGGEALLGLLRNNVGQASSDGLPSLRDMFFAKCGPLRKCGFSPNETFDLKIALRGGLRPNAYMNETAQQEMNHARHELYGTITGQRRGSKVSVSRPYGDPPEIRLWGWLPRDSEDEYLRRERDAILSRIKAHLGSTYSLVCWEALQGIGTQMPGSSDVIGFYRHLMGLP